MFPNLNLNWSQLMAKVQTPHTVSIFQQATLNTRAYLDYNLVKMHKLQQGSQK